MRHHPRLVADLDPDAHRMAERIADLTCQNCAQAAQVITQTQRLGHYEAHAWCGACLEAAPGGHTIVRDVRHLAGDGPGEFEARNTPAVVRAAQELPFETCDRCCARAQVVVAIATRSGYLPLLWCGHHFALHPVGYKIRDTRVRA